MSNPLDAPGVTLTAQSLIALRRVALTARNAPSLAALPGGFATKRKGQGLEVADTRDYQIGDDLRHVDRGTTARTGRLHVRQFQEERDQVTLLVADFRPSMFWGLRRAFRSVAAAEVLTLLGWDVIERGGRVGVLALSSAGSVIAPPRGRARGMLDAIGALVQAHSAGLADFAAGAGADQPLDVLLPQAARLTPPGADVVIASGFDHVGDQLAARLDGLAQRRTPRLLLISDVEEGGLPAGRYPIRLPDGRRMRVSLGSDASGRRIVEKSGKAQGGGSAGRRSIAGRDALVLNAGDSVAQTALRLSAARQGDHAA